MRIHEIDAASSGREEARRSEVQAAVRRTRGERVRNSGGHIRLGQIIDLRGWIRRQRAEEEIRITEEGRLTVELQVVLGLENVIGDTETAAQAGLAVAARIPGEAESRS